MSSCGKGVSAHSSMPPKLPLRCCIWWKACSNYHCGLWGMVRQARCYNCCMFSKAARPRAGCRAECSG